MVSAPSLMPSPALAADAARVATGHLPVVVRRFRTGAAHYVYEVLFNNLHPVVVVRMGMSQQRVSMAEGVRLMQQLRPLDVPLPTVLAAGLDAPCPWVALERLPGTDLGHVIANLADAQLRAVAKGVAAAQVGAARMGSAGRYGYATTAAAAPYHRWSAVLESNLARSRARMSAAGLFRLEPAEAVSELVERKRDELDAQPAVAFLHDTTMRNVVVAPNGRLSGIVDVDDLCWGDPRYVLALTLAVLLSYGGPPEYVRHWMRAAEQRDDALFRLYVALFLVDLMAEHGQRFNGNEQHSTAATRDALLRAFKQAWDRALS